MSQASYSALGHALSRRCFFAAGGAAMLALTGRQRAAGDEPTLPDGSGAKDMITPETQKAIDRGLAYLAQAQQPDGGYGHGSYQGNVAITSLAGLAFMAGGHQPGRGLYGKNVTRALQFVLSKERQDPPGFLYNPTGSATYGPMYSHGFGTLLLAEAHGMVIDRDMRKRVRDTLGRALKVIENSQNSEGGWRYQPIRFQADTSVTICQIMALRSARNAGLEINKSVVDQCVKYVRDCQSPDGGFRYFKQGGPSAFPRSAACVCALYSAGIYQGREVERGLQYLMQSKPNGSGFYRSTPENHYFYGHYYAAQAMWTAGGKYWQDWFPAIREELLNRARQRGDGGWTDNSVGTDYGTAMACIILQIPNNYLPIFQK